MRIGSLVWASFPEENFQMWGIICWWGQGPLTWEVYIRDGGLGMVFTFHENDLKIQEEK